MTKHLENAFGLPHLDDLMKDEGALQAQTFGPAEADQLVAGLRQAQGAAALMDGTDHAEAMDVIAGETLDYAQKVMDLGFNIDPARAPRMFEVATGLYKASIDAKNSKRDAQLKAAQLIINQQKLELEKRAVGAGAPDAIETKGMMVEDRNDLIKRLREQAKNDAADK
jgi:hypothetical protein